MDNFASTAAEIPMDAESESESSDGDIADVSDSDIADVDADYMDLSDNPPDTHASDASTFISAVTHFGNSTIVPVNDQFYAPRFSPLYEQTTALVPATGGSISDVLPQRSISISKARALRTLGDDVEAGSTTKRSRTEAVQQELSSRPANARYPQKILLSTTRQLGRTSVQRDRMVVENTTLRKEGFTILSRFQKQYDGLQEEHQALTGRLQETVTMLQQQQAIIMVSDQ